MLLLLLRRCLVRPSKRASDLLVAVIVTLLWLVVGADVVRQRVLRRWS